MNLTSGLFLHNAPLKSFFFLGSIGMIFFKVSMCKRNSGKIFVLDYEKYSTNMVSEKGAGGEWRITLWKSHFFRL